jgi:hypothetical protein
MRFKRGEKVRIAWTDPRGQTKFTFRWWNQVDAFIKKFSDEQGRDFRVKGRSWKDWKAHDPRKQA